MATLRVAFLSALALELTAALATALVAVETGLRLLYGHVPTRRRCWWLLLTPEAYLPLRDVAPSTTPARGRRRRDSAPSRSSTPRCPPPAGGAARPRAPGARSRAAPAASRLRAGEARSLPRPGRPVPDEVSLTIRPGELIMLTGPSGAGEEHAAAAAAPVRHPRRRVRRGGRVDLAAIPADPWRTQIAWVPQHPRLFSASVAETSPSASPAPAGRHRGRRPGWPERSTSSGTLPGGYDTVLGRGGGHLSAGQRQKLALARAFLSRAPVLLLDEPTAHLAPVAAAGSVMAVIERPRGRAVPIILVTHRSPRRRARRVMTLDRRQGLRHHGRSPARAGPVRQPRPPDDARPPHPTERAGPGGLRCCGCSAMARPLRGQAAGRGGGRRRRHRLRRRACSPSPGSCWPGRRSIPPSSRSPWRWSRYAR